jgi:hypothetical protein
VRRELGRARRPATGRMTLAGEGRAEQIGT